MSVLTDSNSRALLFTVPHLLHIVLYLYTLLKLFFIHSFSHSFFCLSTNLRRCLSACWLVMVNDICNVPSLCAECWANTMHTTFIILNIIFHYKYRQKIYCSDSTFRIFIMSHWSIHPFRFIAFGITYSIKRTLN